MKRYSKKREAIKEYLSGTKEHPDAERVFRELKPKYPDLSLGTVYRNLKEMKDEGAICSIGTVDDKERFDANTVPHVHAICQKCGRVVDVEGIDIPQELVKTATEKTGFSVSYGALQFFGVCEDCKNR